MRVWVVVVVGSLMVCQQRWYLNTEMMSKHSGWAGVSGTTVGGVGRGGPTEERGWGRNSGEGAPQVSMQFARLCGLECEKSRAPGHQGTRVPWRAATAGAWSCLLGPAQLHQPSPSSQHCSLGHCSAPWLVVFVHKSLWLVFSNVLLCQNKHFGGFIFALFIILGISLAHIWRPKRRKRALLQTLEGGWPFVDDACPGHVDWGYSRWRQHFSGSLQTRSSLGSEGTQSCTRHHGSRKKGGMDTCGVVRSFS